MSIVRINELQEASPSDNMAFIAGNPSGGVSFLVDGNVTNKIEYSDLLDSLRADFMIERKD